RYWGSRGAEFGSHTRTHFDCGSTDRARLESEMLGSKSDLESRLGKPVHFFAFPFGEQRNMSSVAIEVATAAYPYFASSFGGENLPHTTLSHRHLLRKNLYPDLLELELELQSVFDLVDRMRRKFHLRPAKSADSLSELAAGSALTASSSRSHLVPRNGMN